MTSAPIMYVQRRHLTNSSYHVVRMQASGLALPAASVADLAALAGLDEPVAEADAGPTMMSREARALFAAGDGEAGLRAWKVRCSRICSSFCM